MRLAEQTDPNRYFGNRGQRAGAVLDALCSLVPASLLSMSGQDKGKLRLVFNALRQSSSSLEAWRARVNQHTNNPYGFEDDVAPIYPSVRGGLADQCDLEQVSLLDPQDRTRRLLEDLDPADPSWQVLLGELIDETGIKFSEGQRQTILSRYALNEWGAFSSQADIAASQDVSPQRVSQVVAAILKKAHKQQV